MTEAETDYSEGRICGPHCDNRVLHAPGECTTCDEFPVLQQARVHWNINFTGHADPKKARCPAELVRPFEVIDRWHGNRRSSL